MKVSGTQIAGSLVSPPSQLNLMSERKGNSRSISTSMPAFASVHPVCCSSASRNFFISYCLLHFAWVVDDAKYIVVMHVCVSVCLSVCLCVCLSAAVRSHYYTDSDVTWGHGRGCPLVVHYWVDLQSGHGLHCYGNVTRTLVTSLRPSYDTTT